MINSSFLNGLNIEQAKEKVFKKLKEKNLVKKKINYKLRDWGLSRQRYWGCPIPMLYREDGKIIPVEKKSLPVALPNLENFEGSGNPLDKIESWKNTKCPLTGMNAVRETDTFDTFFESSWYFLKILQSSQSKSFSKKVKLIIGCRLINILEELNMLFSTFYIHVFL